MEFCSKIIKTKAGLWKPSYLWGLALRILKWRTFNFIPLYLFQFKIWDSAGQERFKSLTTSYYRNSDAAILVYGIDDEESFESLHRWTKELDRCGKDGLIKIIVGNKSDLEEERAVSQESAVGFALADNAAAAVECSAKENENIEQLFQALARKLISMTSGQFGKAYIKDLNRNKMSSDPSAERLIKANNQSQDENGQNKPKLFNWPCLSSGCFRKICGLC